MIEKYQIENKQIREQNKYFRSMIQNMPELAVLVEHMGTKILPPE